MGTTIPGGRVRRPRRIVPWLAGLGIVATLGTAALLWLLETLSCFDDNTYEPTPTTAPEFLAGVGVVALLACLPNLSARIRA